MINRASRAVSHRFHQLVAHSREVEEWGAEEEEEVARERFVQQKNIRSVSRARFLRSICPDFFLRRFDAICTPPSPIQLTLDAISR